MNLTAAVAAICDAFENGDAVATVDGQWAAACDVGAFEALIEVGLLRATKAASSIECQGCEERCFMPVETLSVPGKPDRSFVICDHPQHAETMGRINVPAKSIRQWRLTTGMLAKLLQFHLGLSDSDAIDSGDAKRLGMLKSSTGRRWAVLNVSRMQLEIGTEAVPVAELLFADNGQVAFDQKRVATMLGSAEKRSAKRYEANTDKRDARKANTLARNQSWRDEAEVQRKRHPDKSESWIANKIAAMPLGRGKSSETIRKEILK